MVGCGTEVALGLPLPPARRPYHLMIKRLSAVREESAGLTEQPRDIFFNMLFHSALVICIPLKQGGLITDTMGGRVDDSAVTGLVEKQLHVNVFFGLGGIDKGS
jgi:hypothetical protein